MHGSEQLVRRSVLEQVAHCASLNGAENIGVGVIVSHHENLRRMRHGGSNSCGCLSTAHHARAFHAGAEAQVHQNDIDSAGLCRGHRGLRSCHLAYNLDVFSAFEYGSQPEANDLVVICQQDPNHARFLLKWSRQSSKSLIYRAAQGHTN